MLKITENYKEIPKDIREKMFNANIYYSEVYFENESKEKELYYVFDEVAILIIVIQRRLIFRFVELPTEPFAYGNNFNESLFLDEVVFLCKTQLHVDWIGPSAPTALFLETPQNAKAIPFGSHIIDLTMSEEEIWVRMHSKHRNVIRKAEKEGVDIQVGQLELLSDYQRLDEETWSRSGQKKNLLPVYKKLFMNYPNHAILYMAYLDEEAQGGAIFFKNEKRSYYLYGASKSSPTTGAMNYLHWRAIKDFKQEGIQQYSFVGCRINEDVNSKYHGIQRFKERFGGKLIVGQMFKVILKPYKYQIFRFIQRIKRGYWVQDVIDQEINKWKK